MRKENRAPAKRIGRDNDRSTVGRMSEDRARCILKVTKYADNVNSAVAKYVNVGKETSESILFYKNQIMQVCKRIDMGKCMEYSVLLSNGYSIVAQQDLHMIHIRRFVKIGDKSVATKKGIPLMPEEMANLLGYLQAAMPIMKDPATIVIY